MALRLKPIKELIMEWCEIISEGKSGLVLEQEMSVWLSCYGIPLNLWNSTNVKRIGGLWGHFLYCEGDMNQPKSFACAKIKISTKCMEPINKNRVDTEFKPHEEMRSEEVEHQRCWGSDTMVAKLRSGVEPAMGIGNNNIRSPIAKEECKAMMDLGNHNVGSEAVISGIRQSMDDQILTPGYVRSLGGSSLNRPGVQIEVQPKYPKITNGPKDKISNIKEGAVAVGTVKSSLSVSEAQELEPSLRPAQNKKEKKKVSFLAKHGYLHPKKGPLSLLRRYGHRGASTSKTVPKATVWRAAVAAISLSALVENVTDKGRHILTEAQATLKMGEVLGVNCNGKEDEVLHKIVELELKDKERIGRGERDFVLLEDHVAAIFALLLLAHVEAFAFLVFLPLFVVDVLCHARSITLIQATAIRHRNSNFASNNKFLLLVDMIKMGTHIFLVTIAIMALASTLVYASDPSPLQDFCVAVNDTKSAVFVNGKVCKDPKLAKAKDFFFSGLLTPQKISNPVGSTVTPVNVMQIPGLNTLGISLARIDFAPHGLNPPHTHPRATEVIVVLEGTLYVGFVTSNPENRLFTKVLYPGDVFVFPEGLIHFQFNEGKTNAVAIAGLSSQNPGVITVANAVFGSNPKIFDDVLAKAFQVDKKVVDYLQAQFWWPNN
ncbi:hypothetical protein TEA_014145 [Camellia sinensis var. sinensis]|uniref:Cupin type-1 domain-containing protein n=2 Tax=Camellia sinensis TaxID=4442 RepID=A0A4S4DK01_CAMSN|nr:hypothetical protein TEA_014145 [Camellia sinensis var. sinensis]